MVLDRLENKTTIAAQQHRRLLKNLGQQEPRENPFNGSEKVDLFHFKTRPQDNR